MAGSPSPTPYVVKLGIRMILLAFAAVTGAVSAIGIIATLRELLHGRTPEGCDAMIWIFPVVGALLCQAYLLDTIIKTEREG